MSTSNKLSEENTLDVYSKIVSKKSTKHNTLGENVLNRKENDSYQSLLKARHVFLEGSLHKSTQHHSEWRLEKHRVYNLEKQDTCKDNSLRLHVTGSSQDTIESDPFSFSSNNKSLKYSHRHKQDAKIDRDKTFCELYQEKEIDLNNSSLIFKEKKVMLKNHTNDNIRSQIGAEVDTVPIDTSINDDILITVAKIKSFKGKHVEGGEKDLFDDENGESTLINQCPICFKSVTKYVIHMKSCAAKHKLSTQQLLSAIKLQKRQLAERKELGLGVPAPTFRAKVSPKRSKVKKVPKDSSLELALALSESLRSAEEIEVIKEAEVLKEAGLSQEAHQKLGILENFGFHSALSVTSRGIGVSKSLPSLLRRTQEERERIVTEKVAIVLINEEVTLDSFCLKKPVVKSKALKEMWRDGAILWAQAHCPIEQRREAFYVQSLAAFISPSKAEVGQYMRRLSQLPGRLNTPDYRGISEQPTTKKGDIFDGTNRKLTMHDKLFKLVKDWKALVNNSELSDLVIMCKDGEILSAHKLVFHVRCPSVLTRVVEKSDSKDILMWNSCSRTAILALLDYIYSGSISKLSSLELDDLTVLNNLSEIVGNIELKTMLETLKNTDVSIPSGRLHDNSIKRRLFKGIHNNNYEKHFNQDSKTSLSDLQSFDDKCSPKSSGSNNILEQNASISPDCVDMRSGQRSPDMFDETKVTDHFSTQDDLEMLASLVGKTTSKVENFNTTDNSSESLDKSTGSKRKFSDLSSSLDINASLVKKSRSESVNEDDKLGVITGRYAKDEDVFDLTQSSNSSSGVVKSDGHALIFYDSPKESDRNSEVDEEYIGDLTQMNPSSSPKVLSLEKSTTWEETNHSICKDDIDPVDPGWCGYDDDWQYNYDIRTPAKLPQTPNNKSVELNTVDSNTNARRSVETSCVKDSPNVNCSPFSISSHSISPQPLTPIGSMQPTSLSTPNSKSPGKRKQRILHHYTPESDKLQSSFITNEPDENFSLSHPLYQVSSENKLHNPREFANEQFSSSLNSITESDKFVENKNSSNQIIIDSRSHLPQTQISNTISRNSLDAMKCLLDDTFDVNDSFLSTAEAVNSLPSPKNAKTNSNQKGFDLIPLCSIEQPGSSKSCEPRVTKNDTTVKTPCQDIIVSDNVTPLPNYSALKTPFLKKELTKFGIKPSLGKRKAKLLLRFIYDQTHPVVPNEEQFKQQEKEPPKPPVKSPCKSQEDNVDLESGSEKHLSLNSSSSSLSSLMEESCDFDAVDGQFSQDTRFNGDVQTAIKNVILGDSELHRKVVMYEAIFLEDLMKMIKERSIRAKADEVKKFLDEQCITFRTKSWQEANNRRQQRSPKKKNNKTKRGPEGLQNVNLQIANSGTTVPKKRGRPRRINSNL